MLPLPGDPIWHVSSRSGVALRTAILPLPYLLPMCNNNDDNNNNNGHE